MGQEISIDHSTFLQQAFEKTARERTFSDPLEELLCAESIEISRDFDLTQIQESWSWRNAFISRELVHFLIDGKGDFKRRALTKTIGILERNLHSLGPNRHHDSLYFSHALSTLRLFAADREYVRALGRINRPENHQGAINLIRATLFLPEAEPVTDAHARKASLAALLTSLRQNVGSCFATAPAIMIQQEQPLQFLTDIGELFGTGRLTRVYEGVEYTVPISVNWGMGDLFRPVYLASLGRDPVKILAFSPGLHAAFEAAGVIKKELSREQRQKATEKVIRESGDWFEPQDPFAFFTADDLLKRVFLHRYGLTEEEVKTYQEKPVEGIIGEIVIQAPRFREGKGSSCELFERAYEKAKVAFKALTDNPLLKAWEFTLASLSESKTDFAKWNLYASLGVHPDEPHGIGQSLSGHLQEQVDRINNEIEEYQSRYEHLFTQAKYLEGRLQRASTANELEWLRADYRLRQQEINRVLSERDEMHEKGRKLVNLFPAMIKFYGIKIREYFQEVYDPQMHDVTTNPYDDSPAGFRLLYKHGRANTALWTMINTAGEYIQYLSAFFIATENELIHLPENEGVEKEISELVTMIITTIKQPEFLETSFFRLARAYREPVVRAPLDNLASVKRKPWAYISGGTMGTLVSCYYSNPESPQEEKRWVESAKELLAFFIDTIKELPFAVQQLYQKNPSRSMLAHSPTHAYLCKPGWRLLKNAWESDLYTYTWIRDMWHQPQLNFLDDHVLDNRMLEHLAAELLRFLQPGHRPLVRNALKDFPIPMRAYEFREHVIKNLSYEKWLQGGRRLELIAEELDSILYRSLPLFPEHALHDRLSNLVEEIHIDVQLKDKLYQMIGQLEIGRYQILSADDLRKILKGLIILAMGSTRAAVPFHEEITEAMQALKFAYPTPILCADTNWVKNTFGFTVNPGTGKLDFWRFDACGSEGRPISIWRRYLNGTDRQEWGLYVAPFKYGQFL